MLDGPRPVTVRAPSRFRITDALIDGEYAVVTAEDQQAGKPQRGHGDRPRERRAVHDRRLVRRADHDRRDLGARRAARCSTPPSGRAAPTAWPRSTWPPGSPRRAGARRRVTASTTPGSPRPATSVLTFDDQRPSCRTVGGGDRHRAHPVPRRHGVQGLGRRAARRRRGLVGGAAARTRSRPRSSSPGSATGTSTSAPARPAAWSRARDRRTSCASRSATATRPD